MDEEVTIIYEEDSFDKSGDVNQADDVNQIDQADHLNQVDQADDVNQVDVADDVNQVDVADVADKDGGQDIIRSQDKPKIKKIKVDPRQNIILDDIEIPEQEKEDLIAKRAEYKDAIASPTFLKIKGIRESIPMDQHIKWYNSEYMKQWQYNKMPNISKALVAPENGSILRIDNISTMKYKYTYNTMDMIVVVMKLNDYTTKKETNYGTLFCELLSGIKPVRKAMIKDEGIHGNVVFSFYSASPSFISCDGEYRSRFSLYKSALMAKRDYADIWHELEEYVGHIKVRRQWSLYTSYFYPKLEQESKNTEIEYSVKNEMVPMTVFIITWFHTIYNEMIGMTKTHINENFKQIFLREKEIDIKFLKDLIKKCGPDRVDAFRAKVSHSSANFRGADRYMQCGYKMIPLNIKEVQDPLRLRYKPWREYFLSNKCNDLVVNSICPSFPITLDWFYIKNSRKGLYDNKSQYERMKNSELAKDILHVLYEAQRGTYFASESLKSINKTSNQIKQFISAKFKKLSEKIDDPINYSIEEIIMSEVTLAFAGEYVGRTFADSIAMIPQSKLYDAMINHPFKDTGYDYFAKYVFEVCYALFCINSKLGIIHGDFHLNNVTIGALYYPDEPAATNKDRNNKVAYVIDDNHQYIFPTNGYFASIIDFSRGVINPNTYAELKDISLPVAYQLVKDEEKFKAHEMNTLMTLYTQMFPNKLKQKEELIVLFKNHFDAVFRLLTCMDIYMFSIRLSRLLRQVEFPVSKRSVDLVDKINRLAEGYIATDMNHLINDTANYAKKITSEDYPILTIIKKCFMEYNDGQIYMKDDRKIGTIVDTYIYNNEMKYSIAKYDAFPEILKTVKYFDGKKEVEIQEVTERRRSNREEYEREKIDNLSMMTFIAIRHQQKLL